MAMSRECPKCQGSMVEGLVIDIGYGTRAVSSWLEGPPKRSMWTGVKIKGLKQAEIKSMRCSRCGFLENYAPD